MIEQILAWFSGAAGTSAGTRRPRDELQLALAALLVEAAEADDHFDDSERRVIADLLERRFKLSRAQALTLLDAAKQAAESSAELYHFTHTINERLSLAERIELVDMLWEVAYADGVLDKFEDSLLRRVGGLIYIPDRERGMARQRVLQRLGIDDANGEGGPP
jgi:uncharacterized tellurite resistance protein B-like protein